MGQDNEGPLVTVFGYDLFLTTNMIGGFEIIYNILYGTLSVMPPYLTGRNWLLPVFEFISSSLSKVTDFTPAIEEH